MAILCRVEDQANKIPSQTTCPLCQIIQCHPDAKKSEWWYHGPYGAVVEDLKPGPGGTLRLMWVCMDHVHINDVTPAHRAEGHGMLITVANTVGNIKGLQLTGIDYKMSIPDHYHLQAILSEV